MLRLREELEQAAQAAVAEALDELEAHTGERRRVIEEIAERLRLREQALARADRARRGRGDAQDRGVVRRHRATAGRASAADRDARGRAVHRGGVAAVRAADQGGARGGRRPARARARPGGRDRSCARPTAIFAERLAHTGDAGPAAPRGAAAPVASGVRPPARRAVRVVRAPDRGGRRRAAGALSARSSRRRSRSAPCSRPACSSSRAGSTTPAPGSVRSSD